MFNRGPAGRFLTRRACAVLGFAVLACLPPLLIPALHAQKTEKTEKPTRKLIYKVDPEYPWDLKRAHIGGLVRMSIVVTPRGTVDTISVIGGNPILVETALRAVKRWKYAPADSETTVHVNVDFDPSR
jgi:TonB family protein